MSPEPWPSSAIDSPPFLRDLDLHPQLDRACKVDELGSWWHPAHLTLAAKPFNTCRSPQTAWLRPIVAARVPRRCCCNSFPAEGRRFAPHRLLHTKAPLTAAFCLSQ